MKINYMTTFNFMLLVTIWTIQVGPYMRDVRDRICTQLGLEGMVGDDLGMELLVAGRIVRPNLLVSQVFEQVWRPHVQVCLHPTHVSSSLVMLAWCRVYELSNLVILIAGSCTLRMFIFGMCALCVVNFVYFCFQACL